MRKIEREIIAAIDRKDSYSLSERDRVETWRNLVYVYLHKTCIALICSDHVIIASGGWRTATTKSRLNAILGHYCDARINQKDFVWYVNGKAFADGMQLPRVNAKVSANENN